MCGRFFISNRGKTEPSMPSTTLATNSPHTVPACSLSMWNQTNTTSSEDRNIASSKSSSSLGRAICKAPIVILQLNEHPLSKDFVVYLSLFLILALMLLTDTRFTSRMVAMDSSSKWRSSCMMRKTYWAVESALYFRSHSCQRFGRSWAK